MSHFLIRYQVRGGHTHLDVYAGRASNLTHGKCGTLCMSNDEFKDFVRMTKRAEIEFLDYDSEVCP